MLLGRLKSEPVVEELENMRHRSEVSVEEPRTAEDQLSNNSATLQRASLKPTSTSSEEAKKLKKTKESQSTAAAKPKQKCGSDNEAGNQQTKDEGGYKRPGPRCCDACGLVVMRRQHNMHAALHSGPDNSCTLCERNFQSDLGFIRHLAREHLRPYTGDAPVTCCACRAQYANVASLKQHLKVHSNAKNMCCICEVTCQNPTDLVEHLFRHNVTGYGNSNEQDTVVTRSPDISKNVNVVRTDSHSSADVIESAALDNINDAPVKRKKKRSSFCGVCKTALKSCGIRQLLHHVLRHIKTAGVCPKCGQTFETMSELKKHLYSYAIYNGEVATESMLEAHARPSIQCKICGAIVKNESTTIAGHVVTHVGSNFQCVACDKHFESKLDLSIHFEANHLKLKNCPDPVVCCVCSVGFADWEAVKVHLKDQHCNSDHSCCMCGHKCEGEAQLQDHLAAHVREAAKNDFAKYTCTVCGKLFYDPVDLIYHHNRGHAMKSYYYCDICWYTSKKHGEKLTRHVLRHQQGFTCNHCQVTSSSAQDAREHMRSHAKFAPKVAALPSRVCETTAYVCDVCELSCPTQAQIDEHYTRAHDVKRHVCCECGERFYTKSYLSNHQFHKHSTRNRIKPCHTCTCEQCKKSYNSKHDLDMHLLSHANERPFACMECDHAAKTKSNLRVHIASKHSTARPHKCCECDATFKTRHAHNYHKISKHTVSKHTDVKLFQCDKCAHTFKALSGLKSHMVRHSAERPFPCDQCDYAGKTMQRLRMHKRCHSDTRPYKCDQCNWAFKTSSALRYHKARHQSSRPFQCTQCPATFKTDSDLHGHRTHVHIRQGGANNSLLKRKLRFCPKCDWSTTRHTDYTRHLNQHNGVRPFVCEVCGASFTSKPYLKIHATMHSGEKPHVCKHCGKAFRIRSLLNKHVIQKHSDKRPFVCKLCPKTFKFSEQLRYHQRAHS